MKTNVLNYIDAIRANTGIQVKISIIEHDDKNLYGDVIVGSFGFMLYGTWQPKSDTTFQFKIDGDTGNVFDYKSIIVNHKWANKKIVYGSFVDVFNNKIIDAIKACIGWCLDPSEKMKYKSAIKIIEEMKQ